MIIVEECGLLCYNPIGWIQYLSRHTHAEQAFSEWIREEKRREGRYSFLTEKATPNIVNNHHLYIMEEMIAQGLESWDRPAKICLYVMQKKGCIS